jgi:excisionase family DNA binding protein
MKEILLTPNQAAKRFGVHVHTLREWDRQGKIKTIRTVGGDRRYVIPVNDEIEICYCRVSSAKQKDDLQRQVEFMVGKYPNAQIVKDIGSGLNYKRKGLKAVLERAIGGDCITLYIAHKDRLCRFGFELIQWIIERSGGRIVVFDGTKLSPEQELTQDLLHILHVFSCRMHGLRSYRRKIREAFSNKGAKENI